MAAKYEIKRTHELAEGDIVMNNGMRTLLTNRSEYDDFNGNAEGLVREGLPPKVYSFVGKILNVEEVNDNGLVPFSWRCETRPQFKGTDRYSDKGDVWMIQGNGRAHWHVEVQ
jgi:hypothetical protein